MRNSQSVTSVGQSPEDERRGRMQKYLISQIIRVICIILAVFVQGWLMWVFFAGAIFLPYFAVVIANAQGQSSKSKLLTSVTASNLKIDAESFYSSSTPSEPSPENNFLTQGKTPDSPSISDLK